MVCADELSTCRVLFLEQGDRLGPGAAGILLQIPGWCADLRQELLHCRVVAAEKGPVAVAGVPVDQHPAEVKHDGVAAIVTHS